MRDARRRNELTQADLAEAAGVTQPTISNVERGTASVSLGTLLRVLAVLRLELILQDRVAGEPEEHG